MPEQHGYIIPAEVTRPGADPDPGYHAPPGLEGKPADPFHFDPGHDIDPGIVPPHPGFDHAGGFPIPEPVVEWMLSVLGSQAPFGPHLDPGEFPHDPGPVIPA